MACNLRMITITFAVKLLKERFRNSQIVVKFVPCLPEREIPACSNEPMKLQATHNKIEKLLRSLKALGENIENSLGLLGSLILSKLLTKIKFEHAKHKNTHDAWTALR